MDWRFATFWIAWLAVGFAVEMLAIHRKLSGDTLSEAVWSVLDLRGWGKFVAWMLVAFLTWAAVHFVSRGKWA